ncbi:MAG: glycosyltransferase [Bacillota bacterium]
MSDANSCITSIILVNYNKLEDTKKCVESIRRHTERGDYELIVADKGSADDTAEWAQSQSDILVINNNGYDTAFPKICNLGIAAASGELIMLLDNDTVVTPGWLDGLKRCILSDSRIGAVGPVTNGSPYWSSIPVDYKTIEEMELFASAMNAAPDKTKWEERVKLLGHCLLMRRKACEKAGPLDESAGMENFMFDDYSLRLRLAGYKLMLCGDTFIHRNSSGSDGSHPQINKHTFKENTDSFVTKWGFHPYDAMDIRMDLIAFIQRESYGYKREACRVMEIGCGCGATLLYLKKIFPKAKWLGVERNNLAASIAAASGIQMLVPNDQGDWDLPQEELDGIIIGSANARVTTPSINRLVSLLKPNGWLIGCYANRFYYENIRHYLDPANAEEQHQSASLYTMRQLNHLYVQAGLPYVKITLAGNKPKEQLAYIRQLDRLTGETITDELTAAHLLAYGRKAAAGVQANKLEEAN